MASCWRVRPLHLVLLLMAGSCQPAADESDTRSAVASKAAREADPATTELTCSSPVKADDTAASLQERYGSEARSETLYGPEGTQFPGVVLWPDDAARRLEVVFAEGGQLAASGVQLGTASNWRIAGLALGETLARATEANGKPFKIWGFSWDYGGYVSDLQGGKLVSLPGGCRAVLRFETREGAEVPDALLGEVQVSSDDPRLEAAGVTIDEMSLAF